MTRVIGIDPGSLSFDLCGLDDGKPFLEMTIASDQIAANPRSLLDALDAARPLDLVIGPSGYGLPWVRIEDFSEVDYFLLALADERERGQASAVGGLRKLIAGLQQSGLPIVFMPGVIHLPSVPAYRKANKIDMGTADKLACVALGLFDFARHHQVSYDQASFIYVELGGAFTAVIAVHKGQVVDGQGGSSGAPGFYAGGAMDGELAYLLGKFPKSVLFSGGVAYVAGQSKLASVDTADLLEVDPTAEQAWESLFEGVLKGVAAEMAVVPAAQEILLSGRLCQNPVILAELTRRLNPFGSVRRITGLSESIKEAAQGAALIADGLIGGQFADLIETMRLQDARGTVLDHIYVSEADDLRQRYLPREK